MDVTRQIEARIVNRARRTKVEKMHVQPLAKPRYPSNRKTDVPVAILGIEESGVQR